MAPNFGGKGFCYALPWSCAPCEGIRDRDIAGCRFGRDGTIDSAVAWTQIPSNIITIGVCLDIFTMSTEKVAVITGASSGTFPVYLRSLALDC